MPRIYCLALVLSILGSTSRAQHDAMVELYGEGVHRFYNSDFTGADQILSTVVDSGSEDPRAYYFRGLAREMSGGSGDMDFETGARLEAEGKRSVNVGQALMRIQCPLRSKIEKARLDARILAKQQQLMVEQARAQQLQSSGAAPAVTPPSTAGNTPFPTELEPASDIGMEPAPATPEISDTGDPFSDEPAASGTPSAPASGDGGNPFGDSPEPAVESTPLAEPAADSDNPFAQ